ncbi:MAG: hypothetical protein CMO01_01995 [Thalassobius sp.]|nr:hypothetical protein [Thalassovita sp.]
MKHLISIILLTTSFLAVNAQSNSQNAEEAITQAINYMDNGKINEAIVLLEQAQDLYPDNINIPYEMAYAYQLAQDYDKCIKVAKPLLKRDDVFDQVYQLIGNSYDLKGQPEKGIKIYDKGLEKFPTSGKLYLEKGIVLANQSKWVEAFDSWEAGIVADPDHSSNYYYATQVLADSKEKIWAVYYGEMFLNLEPNTKRSLQMSKSLFEIYRTCLPIKDGKWGLDFSHKSTNITLSMNNLNADNLLNKLMSFETVHNLAMEAGYKDVEPEFTLANLIKIRKQFLEKWNESYKPLYPNLVFDYHDILIKNEMFEPYYYWLMQEGAPDEFEAWKSANEEKYESFLSWYSENPMNFSEENKTNRIKYQ